MNLTQIETEALALPIGDRAELARRLLQSLEELSDNEFEECWGEESARRAANYDAGQTQTIPGDVVAQKARSFLK